MTKEKVRAKITNTGIRPDGRKLDEVRKICLIILCCESFSFNLNVFVFHYLNPPVF